MKKLLIVSFALLTLTLNAQITVPKASPAGKIEQRVGLADLSITYNRPAKRERVVFGDVVPFGEMWRFGANETTNLTTSQALIFGKDTLKSGSYAIYVKPTKDNWEIVFESMRRIKSILKIVHINKNSSITNNISNTTASYSNYRKSK